MRFGMVRVGLVGAGLTLTGLGVSARAGGWQQTPSGQGPIGAAPNPPLTRHEPADPIRDKIEAQQLLSQAEQRHQRMITDADKLLQLATELKEEVDKSTKNEMSVPTIQKAAEIEKLAHDVKQRMKGE